MIKVYNITKESHEGPNNYMCFRGVSVLANPYTHIKDRKTKAQFVVKDRDTAVELYSNYFDKMYGSNVPFTEKVDEIFNKYKCGEEIWLGCYCSPERCHCDIIKEKLERRLIKEKIAKIKIEKNENFKAKKILD